MTTPQVAVKEKLKSSTLDIYAHRISIINSLWAELSELSGYLLDFGCGEMPYKSFILSHNSKITKYVGMDIRNPSYQTYAQPDIYWDGHSIPLDDYSVDCVIATELFEHLPHPEQVFREIHRVLKPHGLLFFTIPFLWPLHDVPNDQYRYTPFSLTRLLCSAGFTEINLKSMGFECPQMYNYDLSG